MISNVLGIDFGTSICSLSVYDDGGPRMVPAPGGGFYIPSVVGYDDRRRFLVGARAQANFKYNPYTTIYGFKRFLGRRFTSPYVRKCKDHFTYKIERGPGDSVRIPLHEHTFRVEELATILLKHLRETAEAEFGDEAPREAILSVPAYSNHPQRQAVRTACAEAGLLVRKIINEPTAACLTYAYGKNVNKTVLVFDLGGGTFDCTLMRIEGNTYQVLGTSGNPLLGGMDFDQTIVKYLLERLRQEHKVEPGPNPIMLHELRARAEALKIALSHDEAVDYRIEFPGYLIDRAKPVALTGRLTRADLNVLCSDLVRRTIFITRKLLEKTGIEQEKIDDLILVGGQTQMPLVRQMIERFFHKQAIAPVDATLAVAKGCAIQAAIIDLRQPDIDETVFTDVLPMSIGFYLPDSTDYRPVFAAGTPVNRRMTVDIPTTRDNQRSLELEIRQGDETDPYQNELVGYFEFDDIPLASAGEVTVHLDFAIDREGVLSVEGRDSKHGRVVGAKF